MPTEQPCRRVICTRSDLKVSEKEIGIGALSGRRAFRLARGGRDVLKAVIRVAHRAAREASARLIERHMRRQESMSYTKAVGGHALRCLYHRTGCEQRRERAPAQA